MKPINGKQSVGTTGLVRAAVLAIALSVALVAWAQTIRIPDFRQAPPAPVTFRAGEVCTDCGRILAIREIQVERRPQVPQALQSNVPGPTTGPGQNNMVGAVIYLPLGSGQGDRPFVGGVGTPEMRERFQETTYEISVRLDDGSLRFLQRPDGTRYRVGDKVRLPGAGQIELLAD
jgi:outer membrane lipoprotein SlyB